jgi:hypothetical protein
MAAVDTALPGSVVLADFARSFAPVPGARWETTGTR